MGSIHYNLTNGANLKNMAPQPLQDGKFTDAQLPGGLQGPGIYMIVNTIAPKANRYIGISKELSDRFGSRMSVVTELGFGSDLMAKISLYWGGIVVQDTPTLMNQNPQPSVVQNYNAPLQANIDGSAIKLERLLIRMMITRWVPNDTVSNNVYAKKEYVNPTPFNITVRVTWGAGGYFNTDSHTSDWLSPVQAQNDVNAASQAVQNSQGNNQQANSHLVAARQRLQIAQTGW